MPYKTGSWGEQAKARQKRRLKYFREYSRKYQKEHLRFTPPAFNSYGSLGEKIGLGLLPNSELVRKRTHDILWQGKKIEVKIATFKRKKTGHYYYDGWRFLVKIQKGKADYFLLICMAKDKRTIEKAFLIPDKSLLYVETATIPLCSHKYEKFEMKVG